jgi:hypothetical protein
MAAQRSKPGGSAPLRRQPSNWQNNDEALPNDFQHENLTKRIKYEYINSDRVVPVEFDFTGG